jgi:hypothetical protein
MEAGTHGQLVEEKCFDTARFPSCRGVQLYVREKAEDVQPRSDRANVVADMHIVQKKHFVTCIT